MMMLFKGIFAALAGPAPNYDMQKILSTRSPKEASKMTGFVSIILLPIRYSMIIGLTVLDLLYYNQLNLQRPAGGTDFEKVLPAAINNFLPVGILGLVLTGLLGAFMGTFSGTLNAAQAYIVNDIYLKYVNPQASTKKDHCDELSGGCSSSGDRSNSWVFCKGCKQRIAMDRIGLCMAAILQPMC